LCSEKQKCKFLLLQCHTPSKSLCSTLFAVVYKKPLNEAFCFLPLAFTVGFELGLLLWAFWCGEILKGKRITKGERIAGKLL
jgi:hypothetical protein